MIRIFKNLGKKEWLMVLVCVGLVVLQVHLELLLPDYMKEITTLVTSGQNEMSDVMSAGGKMLACAFASLITAFLTAQKSRPFLWQSPYDATAGKWRCVQWNEDQQTTVVSISAEFREVFA